MESILLARKAVVDSDKEHLGFCPHCGRKYGIDGEIKMKEPSDSIKQFNEAMAKIPLKDPSSSIPWRKPEERPGNAKDVLCILKNSNDFFSGTCYWGDQEWKYTIESELSDYKMRPENLFAWVYSNELPLPYWIKP